MPRHMRTLRNRFNALFTGGGLSPNWKCPAQGWVCRVVAAGCIALSSTAASAASPARTFAECAGRYSAVIDFPVTPDEQLPALEQRHAQMIDLLGAVEPMTFGAQAVKNWHGQSKSAVTGLLDLRHFSASLRQAKYAEQRVLALLAQCDGLIL